MLSCRVHSPSLSTCAQDVGPFRARRQQQGFDLRLGQFALGVERQLPQQTPAARQGQGFAVLAQVLAQGLGQGPSALLRRACRPLATEHQQGAQ
jgi:hypothetical protein